MIERVFQTLKTIKIGWNMDEVLLELPCQGLQLVQSAGMRRTFQDASQQKYSFYFRKDGYIRCVEATFDVRFDTEMLSRDLYELLINEMKCRYDVALSHVVANLGEGQEFSIGNGSEMPHERDAIKLTIWEMDQADLMLELKHESMELPVRILLTLVPTCEW